MTHFPPTRVHMAHVCPTLLVAKVDSRQQLQPGHSSCRTNSCSLRGWVSEEPLSLSELHCIYLSRDTAGSGRSWR